MSSQIAFHKVTIENQFLVDLEKT